MNAANAKPDDVEAWLSELGLPSADRDYKPGHERVLKLIAALKEQGFAFTRPKLRIRVAGTNGKGSTSHFLANALEAAGFSVGLYTSPHILSFHERIRVHGRPISHEKLMALMTLVMPVALKVQTSYFETATVIALLAFSQNKLDVEILEAGVGAKLDATTAVEADIGILTPVGLDHCDWLGAKIEQIAKDKLFVFKDCKKAISAKQNEVVTNVIAHSNYSVKFAEYFQKPLLMIGVHQRINAGLAAAALRALKELGFEIDITQAERAIETTTTQGRLEYLQYQGHDFWLDAAHNEHAILALLPTLKAFPEKFDVLFLCTRPDRDLTNSVPLLKQFAKKIVVMTGDIKYEYQTVTEALQAETAHLEHARFLILGSFITVADAMRWMNKDV